MTAPRRFYPIGEPDVPWGDDERAAWFGSQTIQRSYRDDVLAPIDAIAADRKATDRSIDVIDYGALSLDPDRYPLKALRVPSAQPAAPWALITGGVHGYETSGVHGALKFAEAFADRYHERLNMIVAPCVSPWGYEVINRWNPHCVDPNRSFFAGSPSEEAAALMGLVERLGLNFLVHLDLHETTDSDENEFRPALAARDGITYTPGLIPDGFYTVGDSEHPEPDFLRAIIDSVETVTHIADADDAGEIIGSPVTQRGVIEYPNVELGLCAGMTNARYTTTTEVYPDSPRATPAICVTAQVAAITGGLDFALAAG